MLIFFWLALVTPSAVPYVFKNPTSDKSHINSRKCNKGEPYSTKETGVYYYQLPGIEFDLSRLS